MCNIRPPKKFRKDETPIQLSIRQNHKGGNPDDSPQRTAGGDLPRAGWSGQLVALNTSLSFTKGGGAAAHLISV